VAVEEHVDRHPQEQGGRGKLEWSLGEARLFAASGRLDRGSFSLHVITSSLGLLSRTCPILRIPGSQILAKASRILSSFSVWLASSKRPSLLA
jgi:hypothetical protein